MSAGKEHIIATQKAQTDYTDRNNQAIPFYHDANQTATKNERAETFTRRIGNTVYRVNVHYSETRESERKKWRAVVADKDAELADKDAEIAALKAQISGAFKQAQ